MGAEHGFLQVAVVVHIRLVDVAIDFFYVGLQYGGIWIICQDPFAHVVVPIVHDAVYVDQSSEPIQVPAASIDLGQRTTADRRRCRVLWQIVVGNRLVVVIVVAVSGHDDVDRDNDTVQRKMVNFLASNSIQTKKLT